MWPQQTRGQRSSWDQWPLVSTYFYVFSNLIFTMIAKVCDPESRRDSWFENRLVDSHISEKPSLASADGNWIASDWSTPGTRRWRCPCSWPFQKEIIYLWTFTTWLTPRITPLVPITIGTGLFPFENNSASACFQLLPQYFTLLTGGLSDMQMFDDKYSQKH